MPSYKLKRVASHSEVPVKGYTIRGRVWIEKDGELFVGRGRAMLLERIHKFGSISAAARSMRLSYRNAWLWVDSMNRLAESPLVEKNTGGLGGGFARLTDRGHDVMSQFNRLNDALEDYINQYK
jgi:molybdate transport system regulatory protein